MTPLQLLTKVNRRAAGAELAIVDEPHTVGEEDSGFIWLKEVPLQSAGVTIPGFTEVTTTPGANEFRVHYVGRLMGSVEFRALSHDDQDVLVSYTGRGSAVVARDYNRMASAMLGVGRWLTEFKDLNTAIAEIGAAEETLLVNKAVTLTADLTVPANVALVWPSPGNAITPGGFNLTVAGPIDARAWRIFDLSGGGTAALNKNVEARLAWYGGSPTASAATNGAALTALLASGAGVGLLEPHDPTTDGYEVDGEFTHPDKFVLKGAGAHRTFITFSKAAPTGGIYYNLEGAGSGGVNHLRFRIKSTTTPSGSPIMAYIRDSVGGLNLDGFEIDGNVKAVTGLRLDSDNAAGKPVRDVHGERIKILNCASGFVATADVAQSNNVCTFPHLKVAFCTTVGVDLTRIEDYRFPYAWVEDNAINVRTNECKAIRFPDAYIEPTAGQTGLSISAACRRLEFTGTMVDDVGTWPTAARIKETGTIFQGRTDEFWRFGGGLFIGADGAAAKLARVLSATATWDPPSLAAGAATAVTIAVSGAAVGDVVLASHTALGTNELFVSAHVQSADTVRVNLINHTGGAVDVPSGTLRVAVLQF